MYRIVFPLQAGIANTYDFCVSSCINSISLYLRRPDLIGIPQQFYSTIIAAACRERSEGSVILFNFLLPFFSTFNFQLLTFN